MASKTLYEIVLSSFLAVADLDNGGKLATVLLETPFQG